MGKVSPTPRRKKPESPMAVGIETMFHGVEAVAKRLRGLRRKKR